MRVHSRKTKALSCLAASFLAIAACGVLVVALRDRSLLDSATRLAPCTRRGCAYGWLDSDRCLIAENRGQDPEKLPEWSGHVDLVSLRHRTKTPMPRVNRDLVQSDLPGRFSLSPGGSWLYWTSYQTGDGWPSPNVARLDGTAYASWGQDKGSQIYWDDDSHLVEQPYRTPLDMVVHDVLHPAHDRTLDMHAPEVRPIIARHAIALACGRPYIYIARENDAPARAGTFEIDAYKAETYDANGAVMGDLQPDKTYQASIPLTATYVIPEVDQRHGRILWNITGSNTSFFDRLIHRFFKSHKVVGRLVCWLYVSSLDGSHMHEIGHILAAPGSVRSDYAPGLVYDARWLLDGRRVSFGYGGSLYVVPVN